MDRDSKNDSIREMEQIRKGLEDFLNQEVLNQEDSEQDSINQNKTDVSGQGTEERNDSKKTRREPQFFFFF